MPKRDFCACGTEKDARAISCKPCANARLKTIKTISAADAWDRMRATAVPSEEGCLIATEGQVVKGYRRIRADGKFVMAHRHAIDAPNGLTVDHLCHNEAVRRGDCAGGPDCRHRACIEPSHLAVKEAVENWRAGSQGAPAQRRALTHCPQNHPYDEANTHVDRKTGARTCRTCGRLRQREYVKRKRAQGDPS